jgi:hypothetical protein
MCIENAMICSFEAGTRSFTSPSNMPLLLSYFVCATSTVLACDFIGPAVAPPLARLLNTSVASAMNAASSALYDCQPLRIASTIASRHAPSCAKPASMRRWRNSSERACAPPLATPHLQPQCPHARLGHRRTVRLPWSVACCRSTGCFLTNRGEGAKEMPSTGTITRAGARIVLPAPPRATQRLWGTYPHARFPSSVLTRTGAFLMADVAAYRMPGPVVGYRALSASDSFERPWGPFWQEVAHQNGTPRVAFVRLPRPSEVIGLCRHAQME